MSWSAPKYLSEGACIEVWVCVCVCLPAAALQPAAAGAGPGAAGGREPAAGGSAASVAAWSPGDSSWPLTLEPGREGWDRTGCDELTNRIGCKGEVERMRKSRGQEMRVNNERAGVKWMEEKGESWKNRSLENVHQAYWQRSTGSVVIGDWEVGRAGLPWPWRLAA